MQVIEVAGLSKEFGTLVAVNNISFSVAKGQIVGLIGPNGAGKTTLLRMLATLLRPTTGSVKILGYNSANEYLKIRKNIGYLPDFFNLYNSLTLHECLEFFAMAYGVDDKLIPGRVDEALKFVELEEKRNDFVRHLSRGMVQRMGVGVLLVHQPDVLLLDEPASGLDPKARIQLRDILRKLSAEGKTIIISSHILTELSDFCSHVAIMSRGNIVLYGSIDEIRQRVHNSRRIAVSIVGDPNAAVAAIKEFPGTTLQTIEDGNIKVDIKTDENGLAEMNSYLVSKGIRVCGFCEQKSDLEDLFMEISGNEQSYMPEGGSR
jgi:ABC-2 type transport system ATP-binding protein